MSEQGKNNRVDIYIHIDAASSQDGVLPILTEFIGQVYPKLDWIIKQNEEILAGVVENAQKPLDELGGSLNEGSTDLESIIKKENG